MSRRTPTAEAPTYCSAPGCDDALSDHSDSVVLIEVIYRGEKYLRGFCKPAHSVRYFQWEVVNPKMGIFKAHAS